MSERHPAQGEAALQAEVERLNKVVRALLHRVERDSEVHRGNYGMFRDSVVLESQVRRRTAELEAALRENERINRALTREREEQRGLIRKLEEAHNQLLQSEKLASIGQLAAGVAHEINNPIGFVSSNLGTLKAYVEDLLAVLDAHLAVEEELSPGARERLGALRQRVDIDYLRRDIADLIGESIDGTQRVRKIVQDLRDFSRSGDAEWQLVDIHAGLESTLNVVWNELKYKAEVVRDFGQLPEIECLPSQLNQVFLNLLVNAAQSIAEHGRITIRTRCLGEFVSITVADTGSGIAPEIRDRIFDPFFTTKPVGKGTGLGLSVTYGIVDHHGGRIEVASEPGRGSEFTVYLPLRQEFANDNGNVCF
jgi:two-component system NtrC family sensor kinase